MKILNAPSDKEFDFGDLVVRAFPNDENSYKDRDYWNLSYPHATTEVGRVVARMHNKPSARPSYVVDWEFAGISQYHEHIYLAPALISLEGTYSIE